MGAIGTRVQAEFRSRWRSSVALAAVIAVALGVVLAAAAGARRTQTAYPRFLKENHAADVLLSANRYGLGGLYQRVGALPEVERMGMVAGIPLELILPSGRPFPSIGTIAAVDGQFGNSIERPNVIAGRLPDPRRRTEVLVNRFLAERLHVSVGDDLHAVVFNFSPEDLSKIPISRGVRITLRIVGVGVTSTDVVPGNQLDRVPSMVATPAFYRSFQFRSLNFDGAFLKLRPGTDVPRFEKVVMRMAAADAAAGHGAFFASQKDQTDRGRQGILPVAAALAVFALLAGLASFLAVSQMASRQIWVDGLEYPTLRALGMTRRQLVAVALARVALVAAVGGVVGVVIAAAASPLFPIGPARLAETHPGFSVDVAILLIGLVATVALLVAGTAVPAWRAAAAAGSAAGVAERAAPPSRLGGAAVRAGLPVSAATGVRMAVEPGRGRTAVPVRSALAGLAVGVAAVVASSTFGTNLDRLVHEPARYGWNWDAMVDFTFSSSTPGQIHRLAALEPAVAAYSAGVYGNVVIGSRRIPAVGIDPIHGSVYPTLLAGRSPAAPGEIVLGTTTADSLHAGVGRSVSVRLPTGATRTMRVVGEAVFPTFGQGSFTPTSLGQGAELVAADLPTPRVNPNEPPPQGMRRYNFVLVRFRPGTDVGATIDRLRRVLHRAGCPAGFCDQLGPVPPPQIASYRRVVSTPLALSVVLGVLGAALMAHVLVTSVRRRRRDVAVLKTLGFSRGQVGAAVAWQATTLAALSLLVGIPLGIAAGRWAWSFFAGRLGVGSNPTVPVLAVLLAGGVTVVLANAIAAIPARSAARTHPAALLRTE